MQFVLILLLMIFNSNLIYAETYVKGKTLIVTSQVTLPPIPGKTIDDFNDGSTPNLWGGGMSVFTYTPPNLSTSTLAISYSTYNEIADSTLSLRIDYNVPAADAYAGISVQLAPAKATRNIGVYKYISFRVKSTTLNTAVKIALKNPENLGGRTSGIYINDFLDGGITTNWKNVLIPLNAFANLNTLNVNELTFVFEHNYLEKSNFTSNGSVFIDDLSVGDGSFAGDNIVRIDHFGDNWNTNALGGNMGDMADGGGIQVFAFSATTFHSHAIGLASYYHVYFGWSGLYFIFGGGANGYTPQPCNFSAYDKLTMYIRTSAVVKVKLELVDNSGTRNAYITVPASAINNWTKFTTNLSAFSGLDKTTIKQLNIVYEDWSVGAQKMGTVYYDEIQFEY